MELSINRFGLWLLAALLCLVPAGCSVSENEDDCEENLEITFRFMKQGQDQLGSEVSSLDLFAFDLNGRFVGRWTETDNSKFKGNYKMKLSLPRGTYNFIAWGGLQDNAYLICKRGSEDSGSSRLEKGRTRIEELLIRLDSQNQTHGDGQKNYVNRKTEPLFFGSAAEVLLTDDPEASSTVRIDLIKNSTQIDFAISGLPDQTTRSNPFPNLDFYFEAPNGDYDFDNRQEHEDRVLTYIPQNETAGSDNTYYSSIHTLQVSYSNPLHKLIIWDRESRSVFFEADILEEYIKEIPQYATPEALEAEDLFQIEILLDPYLGVKVKVNGWEIEKTGTGIQ